MWVQIAGIINLNEALMIEKAGADSIGFVLGSHEGLTKKKAKEILEKLSNPEKVVLITYYNTEKDVRERVEYLEVNCVQLHGETEINEIVKIRKSLPKLKIIKSVNVTGKESIEEAKKYEKYVDFIILDTYDPESGKRGATGKTHDWNTSREIVEKSKIPVILAGGLNPENVAEAIRKVRPWGVDVHTGVEDENGIKNPSKVKLFIERAKGV